MSRKKAKDILSLEEYKEMMDGIYTNSISQATLDEAPGAYKNPNLILEAIKETAEIQFLMKPVYNFKSA